MNYHSQSFMAEIIKHEEVVKETSDEKNFVEQNCVNGSKQSSPPEDNDNNDGDNDNNLKENVRNENGYQCEGDENNRHDEKSVLNYMAKYRLENYLSSSQLPASQKANREFNNFYLNSPTSQKNMDLINRTEKLLCTAQKEITQLESDIPKLCAEIMNINEICDDSESESSIDNQQAYLSANKLNEKSTRTELFSSENKNNNKSSTSQIIDEKTVDRSSPRNGEYAAQIYNHKVNQLCSKCLTPRTEFQCNSENYNKDVIDGNDQFTRMCLALRSNCPSLSDDRTKHLKSDDIILPSDPFSEPVQLLKYCSVTSNNKEEHNNNNNNNNNNNISVVDNHEIKTDTQNSAKPIEKNESCDCNDERDNEIVKGDGTSVRSYNNQMLKPNGKSFSNNSNRIVHTDINYSTCNERLDNSNKKRDIETNTERGIPYRNTPNTSLVKTQSTTTRSEYNNNSNDDNAYNGTIHLLGKNLKKQDLPCVNIRPALSKQVGPTIHISASSKFKPKHDRNKNICVKEFIYESCHTIDKSNEINKNIVDNEQSIMINKSQSSKLIDKDFAVCQPCNVTVYESNNNFENDRITLRSDNNLSCKTHTHYNGNDDNIDKIQERLQNIVRIYSEKLQSYGDKKLTYNYQKLINTLKELNDNILKLYDNQMNQYIKSGRNSSVHPPLSYRMKLVTDLLWDELHLKSHPSNEHCVQMDEILKFLAEDIKNDIINKTFVGRSNQKNGCRSPQKDGELKIEDTSLRRPENDNIKKTEQTCGKCSKIFSTLQPGENAVKKVYSSPTKIPIRKSNIINKFANTLINNRNRIKIPPKDISEKDVTGKKTKQLISKKSCMHVPTIKTQNEISSSELKPSVINKKCMDKKDGIVSSSCSSEKIKGISNIPCMTHGKGAIKRSMNSDFFEKSFYMNRYLIKEKQELEKLKRIKKIYKLNRDLHSMNVVQDNVDNNIELVESKDEVDSKQLIYKEAESNIEEEIVEVPLDDVKCKKVENILHDMGLTESVKVQEENIEEIREAHTEEISQDKNQLTEGNISDHYLSEKEGSILIHVAEVHQEPEDREDVYEDDFEPEDNEVVEGHKVVENITTENIKKSQTSSTVASEIAEVEGLSSSDSIYSKDNFEEQDESEVNLKSKSDNTDDINQIDSVNKDEDNDTDEDDGAAGGGSSNGSGGNNQKVSEKDSFSDKQEDEKENEKEEDNVENKEEEEVEKDEDKVENEEEEEKEKENKKDNEDEESHHMVQLEHLDELQLEQENEEEEKSNLQSVNENAFSNSKESNKNADNSITNSGHISNDSVSSIISDNKDVSVLKSEDKLKSVKLTEIELLKESIRNTSERLNALLPDCTDQCINTVDTMSSNKVTENIGTQIEEEQFNFNYPSENIINNDCTLSPLHLNKKMELHSKYLMEVINRDQCTENSSSYNINNDNIGNNSVKKYPNNENQTSDLKPLTSVHLSFPDLEHNRNLPNAITMTSSNIDNQEIKITFDVNKAARNNDVQEKDSPRIVFSGNKKSLTNSSHLNSPRRTVDLQDFSLNCKSDQHTTTQTLNLNNHENFTHNNSILENNSHLVVPNRRENATKEIKYVVEKTVKEVLEKYVPFNEQQRKIDFSCITEQLKGFQSASIQTDYNLIKPHDKLELKDLSLSVPVSEDQHNIGTQTYFKKCKESANQTENYEFVSKDKECTGNSNNEYEETKGSNKKPDSGYSKILCDKKIKAISTTTTTCSNFSSSFSSSSASFPKSLGIVRSTTSTVTSSDDQLSEGEINLGSSACSCSFGEIKMQGCKICGTYGVKKISSKRNRYSNKNRFTWSQELLKLSKNTDRNLKTMNSRPEHFLVLPGTSSQLLTTNDCILENNLVVQRESYELGEVVPPDHKKQVSDLNKNKSSAIINNKQSGNLLIHDSQPVSNDNNNLIESKKFQLRTKSKNFSDVVASILEDLHNEKSSKTLKISCVPDISNICNGNQSCIIKKNSNVVNDNNTSLEQVSSSKIVDNENENQYDNESACYIQQLYSNSSIQNVKEIEKKSLSQKIETKIYDVTSEIMDKTDKRVTTCSVDHIKDKFLQDSEKPCSSRTENFNQIKPSCSEAGFILHCDVSSSSSSCDDLTLNDVKSLNLFSNNCRNDKELNLEYTGNSKSIDSGNSLKEPTKKALDVLQYNESSDSNGTNGSEIMEKSHITQDSSNDDLDAGIKNNFYISITSSDDDCSEGQCIFRRVVHSKDQ
ncbi:uncharacterized protein LOC142330950 [Lycorma delicatula]|uniref:uncharacterized protein LOC142330950 n=1 Tax=Lycorma delicatula TaxID=130591 RepID=UPI003F51ABB2